MGEKLDFNENAQQWEPEDAPLFRAQFDYNDSLQAKYAQRMLPPLYGLHHTLQNVDPDSTQAIESYKKEYPAF